MISALPPAYIRCKWHSPISDRLQITIGLALALVFVWVVLAVDAVNRTIVITGLLVPRELQDEGYSPDVVARLLLDEVNSIRTSNESLRVRPETS